MKTQKVSFAHIDCTFLYSVLTIQGKQMTFVFLDCLISLSIMDSNWIHLVAKDNVLYFLWLSYIPLFRCHILFIQSSFNRHLD